MFISLFSLFMFGVLSRDDRDASGDDEPTVEGCHETILGTTTTTYPSGTLTFDEGTTAYFSIEIFGLGGDNNYTSFIFWRDLNHPLSFPAVDGWAAVFTQDAWSTDVGDGTGIGYYSE